jgi:hypothetical protein
MDSLISRCAWAGEAGAIPITEPPFVDMDSWTAANCVSILRHGGQPKYLAITTTVGTSITSPSTTEFPPGSFTTMSLICIFGLLLGYAFSKSHLSRDALASSTSTFTSMTNPTMKKRATDKIAVLPDPVAALTMPNISGPMPESFEKTE